MTKSSHPRFYTPGLITGEVELSPQEARHASSALRLSIGDTVTLFDGEGKFANAKVLQSSKRSMLAKVDEIFSAAPIRPAINLGFAIPKAKRLDWLLEKATELGATTLSPIVFDRSVAGGEKLSASKRQRWESHIISACKQCRLNWLPKLEQTQTLADFLTRETTDLKLLGDLTPNCSTLAKVICENKPESVTILVGPEGGITDQERSQIIEAGFAPVKLGSTILRIETAAIALIAGTIAASDI